VPQLESATRGRFSENLEAEHGRGIHIMKLAMDEVSFQQGGTEVHMVWFSMKRRWGNILSAFRAARLLRSHETYSS
jgi:anti-sigma regulatory factor (Ser/Thr protein kinase)